MNPSFAPGCWSPIPAPRSPVAAQAPHATSPSADEAGEGGRRQWQLQRNCSLAPRQLLAVFVALCALSMMIGLGFWWLGAPAVWPFAGVEVLALAVSFALYARHADDGDLITLRDGELHVEHHRGGRVERTVFNAEWVRVSSQHGPKSLLALSGQGRQALVGRHVPLSVRSRFAVELREALGAARRTARASESTDLPRQAKSSENRS